METLLFWIIGVAVVAGVLAIVLDFVLEKKRKVEMSQVAAALGFSLEPDGKALIAGALRDFDLLRGGYTRKVRNVLRGTIQQADAILFDYQFTEGTGMTSGGRTYDQTVAALRLRSRLPDFVLGPKGVFGKPSSAPRDVSFETNPEFSRNYLLIGSDEQALRVFFNPGVLNVFQKRKGWHVVGRGEWILLYKERVKPTQLREFLGEVSTISRLFSKTSE